MLELLHYKSPFSTQRGTTSFVRPTAHRPVPKTQVYVYILRNINVTLREMKIHMFPILNPPPNSLPIPPLWVIPVHQPQGFCIKPGLAIRFLYDIIYVSMPFSQIIPPPPPPQSPKDCSIHLCLFCCLAYRIIVTIFLNSMYMC